MTNIKPIEPIKKETVTERKPSIKRNIFKEEPKPIDPPKKPEPKIEYVVVEKKNDNDMFTLDEYRQMRAILEVIKENQKKA